MIDDIHLMRAGFPNTECGVLTHYQRGLITAHEMSRNNVSDDESQATCENCKRLRAVRVGRGKN